MISAVWLPLPATLKIMCEVWFPQPHKTKYENTFTLKCLSTPKKKSNLVSLYKNCHLSKNPSCKNIKRVISLTLMSPD